MAELTLDQIKDGARKAAQAGDLATARKLIARAQSMETAKPARAENFVAETPGVPGGRVVRGESGDLEFRSPGAATRDPQIIEQLMRGATYAEATRGGWQEAAIADKPIASRAASAIRGVPFVGEYADEATGAMFGPQARDAQRFAADAIDERRPGQAVAGKVATGLLSAIPMAMAAGPAIAARAPASMAGKFFTGLLGGAAAGGAEGAIAGYGAGTDPQSRIDTAQEYGSVGGVLGGLLGAASGPAASGIRRTVDFLQDRFTGGQRVIPGMTRQASDEILLRAQADDIGGAGAQNIRTAGPQGMIADAGPAMQGLTDQAVSMSPTGANIAGRAVNERAAATAGNLTQVFDDVLGDPQGQRAIATAIRDDARPGINAAYEAAYSKAIDYSTNEGRAIQSLVSRMPKRTVQEAARRASERMTYDGLPAPQILLSIADDGSVTKSRLPNVIELDYMKRALDEIARDGTDTVTGKMSSDAAFASRMARDLRNQLKDAVPEYADALSRASDAFALENARDLGQKLLARNTTREAVEDWLSDAGPMDKKALATALRSDIDERMANATRVAGQDEGIKEARTIFRDMSSPAARRKMELVLGEKEAGKLISALEQAEKALELKSGVAMGSKTAPRMVGDANLRNAQQFAPSEIARETVSGGLLTGPRRVAQIAAGSTPADVAARNDALYGEISQFLTGARGNQAVDAAQQMAGILQYVPRASAASRTAGQVGSGLLGLLGYQLAGPAQR